MNLAVNDSMDNKHWVTIKPLLESYKPEPTVKNKKLYLILKRTFDFTLSLLALVVLIIPMFIIGIMIRLDSPGTALFKQERLGKGGVPFIMYKFRSMRLDAEANGPQWADANDERCTKFGKIIRQYRIDELPQLWNILKGDMSFVGPRPERECFYEEFEEYIPGFYKRLFVQPGLTGYAQINGGYDITPEEKIVLDTYYIKNQSMKLDLICLLKTFHIVVSHEGAR